MSARRLWEAFLVIKGNDTKFIHKPATEGSSIILTHDTFGVYHNNIGSKQDFFFRM